jgi:hypothetical protein
MTFIWRLRMESMNPPLQKSQSPHAENHFRATNMVRDIVIGMADWLMVPFALAAGLAEIVAGSVAMGLGGYLAANGDEEHYARERFREQSEVQLTPEQEVAEIV